MKKLVVLAGMFLFAGALFGQVEIRISDNGVEEPTDVSGTTITLNVTSDGMTDLTFAVKNVSGNTMDLNIRHYRVDEVAGWTDNMCWGSTAVGNFQGNCYTYGVMNTNPWTSPEVSIYPDTVRGMLLCDFFTNGPGCGHYRYTIVSGGTALDSVDVIVCSSVGLNDLQNDLSLSAYPNPTADELHVDADFTGDGERYIHLTDLSGKEVYQGKANPKNTIDTGNLKAGFYLLTLVENGIAIASRRVVIQR